jgi:hypothetical protein
MGYFGANENVLVVNGLPEPREIVDEILGRAVERFPILKKPWWERR